ncbi:hypothetical protein LPE509_03045 [Legionella pneumophila subsp. pneumophila LPE509]|nr:hypothetical protein LPE509_03045 [Legionella pneumophila subsp. pneumophila LPE509]
MQYMCYIPANDLLLFDSVMGNFERFQETTCNQNRKKN